MPDQFFMTWSKQLDALHLEVQFAERDEFVLTDGQRIYDFTSTSYQSSFGHSYGPIQQRIHQQLDRMPIASPKAIFALKEIASRRLLEFIDLDDGEANRGKVFYTTGGSESVENALKIARYVTGRTKVLARKKSYHGATLGSMSVSGDWRTDHHVGFSEGTVRIPEPDDDPDCVQTRQIVDDAGPESIAAVIVETISGVNGVVIPPLSWWDGIVKICRDYDILLICDEVLAGFGRTGPPFAFQHFELKPDFATMAKGITGGYIPFGALWVSDKIASKFDDKVLACGLTNYGHPLGLAAMDAVLDSLTDVTFTARKKELELAFGTFVKQLSDKYQSICGFRQRGLLAAIDFHEKPPNWQDFIKAGLYVVTRDNMLVLAPPFISTIDRLQQAFESLAEVIEQ